jgi:hypothetical protein
MTSNVMQEKETTQEITIVYTNWKGETSIRRILPKQISFGSNEWHPTPLLNGCSKHTIWIKRTLGILL